jgi:hypothetical protein
MANAICSPYSGYILYDAVWSGTAPMSTYSLATFTYLRPDWRVRYSVTTATITATLGASRLADLVVVPMSNLGPSVLSLTNGSGLNVPVPVPAVPTGPYGRLPLTAVLDLRPLASAGTRTASVWNWVITSNSVNITMGAALWLGSAVNFTANFRPYAVFSEHYYNIPATNEYGSVYRERSRAKTRSMDFGVPARDAQRDQLMEWAGSGEGAGLPSVFWPNPSVNDAFLGTLPDDVSNTWIVSNFSPVDGIRFTELSKGIPLL